MSDNQTTPLIDSSGPSVMPIYIILFLLFLSILFNILITFKIVNLDKILNPDPKKKILLIIIIMIIDNKNIIDNYKIIIYSK